MSLKVSVVTPERLLSEKEADAVFFPAVDGEMGILLNHLPVLAQLKAGEVRIKSGRETDSFAVFGGFVEVRNNNVYIFAETAEDASEIDIERARQAAERAKQQMKAPGADVSLVGAEQALRRALIRLNVAENRQRRSSHPR